MQYGQQKKEAQHKPPNRFQRIVAEQLSVTLNTAQTPNNPRKVLAGSVLATCLAFLIAISSQKTDSPLSIASCLFAVPIPFLVIGFILSSYAFEDQRMQLVSFVSFIFEKVGIIIVAVGILLFEYHISSSVFWSTVFSLLVFMVITPIVLVCKGVNVGVPQPESKQPDKQSDSLPGGEPLTE
jgi:hypothetical protein